MRKVLLLALVVVSSASLAFAQTGGGIGLSSDTQGIDCNLWDMVAGLGSYYVVHKTIPGSITCATACQFWAPSPACNMGTYLSDTAVWPVTIGNSQTGVAIGYGSPQVLPVHVLTINFFNSGLTGACCQYDVFADPAVPSGMIEVVDCNNVLHYGVGICAVINPDASCPCWATPAEESTWGKVKSLYTD
ncbi:MAG: hypothetical protein JSW58_04325 [Candidatus Latescibacterota bacterium]|nr:MAG: hypothetical protein JSW58_04325 [Candidatus Latescibacterota bacterium]